MLDSTARDMQLYHNPQFRKPFPDQYVTVYSPPEDEQREKDFILRLQTGFGGKNAP
jgi:hypothetical protein